MNKKKLNVLLLNPPYKEPIIRDNYCCFTSKSQYIWPPIDLLYISGILRHADIAVSVIDAVIEKQSWEVVEKHVLKQKPDVIIMLTGTVSFQDDLEGLRSLVQKTKARSYVLGNTPAFKPLHFLRTYDFLTGIFHNFFDTRIRDEILEKSPSIESISTNKKGKHHIGKVNFLPHNHQLPLISPPQYDLFPLAKYTTPIAKRSPMATVLTGFGCPFTCKFCIASAIDFHPRQIKDLENEFDELQKKGVKEVFFEDSTFNKNETHLNMICNLLIGKNYQFTWSANIHSFNVTETNLRLMKKAGCHTVQIGVESGNQEILNQYAPSKRKEKIEDAFHLCKKVGIRTLGYFIIGFPTEDKNKAKETIDFAKNLNPHFASFSVLTPDYGTKLHDEALQKNLIPEDTIFQFDSSNRAILENPTFSREDQDQLVKNAYTQFYLRPFKMMTYLTDYKNIPVMIQNGLRLIRKKIWN